MSSEISIENVYLEGVKLKIYSPNHFFLLSAIFTTKFLFALFDSNNCVYLLLGNGLTIAAGVAAGVAIALGAGAVVAAPFALSAAGFTKSGRCNLLQSFFF